MYWYNMILINLVLTSLGTKAPRVLFDLNVGRIVDGGLNVALAGLINLDCICKVSSSMSFCAGYNFSTSSLTWSSHDILLSADDGLEPADSSIPSLISVSGGPCDLVLG